MPHSSGVVAWPVAWLFSKYVYAVDFNSVLKLWVFYFIAMSMDNKCFGNECLRYRTGKPIKYAVVMWALVST